MSSKRDLVVCVLSENDFFDSVEEQLHSFSPEGGEGNALKFVVRNNEGRYRNLEIKPDFSKGKGRLQLRRDEILMIDLRLTGENPTLYDENFYRGFIDDNRVLDALRPVPHAREREESYDERVRAYEAKVRRFHALYERRPTLNLQGLPTLCLALKEDIVHQVRGPGRPGKLTEKKRKKSSNGGSFFLYDSSCYSRIL